MNTNQTITLTFGDRAENHKGMQIIGQSFNKGYNLVDLLFIQAKFDQIGCKTELYDLNENIGHNDLYDSYILVINNFFNENELNDLFNEQKNLDYDKKAFMYGRVVNKTARHNLCFSNFSQEPDYENGKGRIISFNSLEKLNNMRNKLNDYIDNFIDLQGESNYYYDITKCGIGYHGDSERKIVIGIRLGCNLPLYYQCYYKNDKIGDKIKIELTNGSIYIMTEKASGNDWKSKNKYTFRHATGCEKFIE